MEQSTIERIVLTADEGKVITDGEIYGKVIYPAVGADLSVYHEITDAEYETIEAMAMGEEE